VSRWLQPPAHSPSLPVLTQLGVFRLVTLQPPVQTGSSRSDSSTLKMEVIRSSETSVHTRSTLRHIPENGILQHSVYSLMSYPCSQPLLPVRIQWMQYVVLLRVVMRVMRGSCMPLKRTPFCSDYDTSSNTSRAISVRLKKNIHNIV
jgi:hypothetical protein